MKLNNKSDLLDAILPEYPNAKDMPKSISQAPGFNNFANDSKALKEFEDRWYAAEKERNYKSMDVTGAIFLIKNPMVWRRKVGSSGEIILLRPQPKFLMSFKQAQKLAEQQGVIPNPRGFNESELNWD